MYTSTISDQTDRRTLACYAGAGLLAGIPSRNDIVAEFDNRMNKHPIVKNVELAWNNDPTVRPTVSELITKIESLGVKLWSYNEIFNKLLPIHPILSYEKNDNIEYFCNSFHLWGG